MSFEIDAFGVVLSNVVVSLAVAVQPFAPVTVTVHVPAVVTVIEAVVAPVLHKYVPPPLAVSVVLGTAQVSAKPLSLEMDAFGVVLSNVVVTLAVAVQPFAPVTVTVHVPAVVTVMDAVVAPVLHK